METIVEDGIFSRYDLDFVKTQEGENSEVSCNFTIFNIIYFNIML